jgi:hypothetical protein
MHGVEVWRKVGGEPQTDDSEYSFVCLSTCTAIVLEYPLTDTGKMVYYRFRWVNSRNQPGPWSENFVSVVIPRRMRKVDRVECGELSVLSCGDNLLASPDVEQHLPNNRAVLSGEPVKRAGRHKKHRISATVL